MDRKPHTLILGAFAGLLGIAAFFAVTPDFAARHLSPNGYLTDQGRADLEWCRILSLVGGVYLFLRAGLLSGRRAVSAFRRSRADGSGRSGVQIAADLAWRGTVEVLFWCSVILMLALAARTAWFVIADANWVFGDDHQLLTTTLVGEWSPNFVIPAILRFSPLGYEYNILLPFGNAPYVYYGWEAFKFLTIVGCTLLTMVFAVRRVLSVGEESARLLHTAACLLVACLITSPGLYFACAMACFHEAFLTFLLALCITLYVVGTRSRGSTMAYGLSLLFGSMALYVKEPTFGAVLIAMLPPFAAGFSALGRKRAVFQLAMVASCLLFVLAFYVWIILPLDGSERPYNVGRVPDFSTGMSLSYFVHYDLWVILLAAPVALVRAVATLVRIVRRKALDLDLLTFDGLLYAGVAYAFAYYLLGIMNVHYFVPCYPFLFPALFYYGARGLRHAQRSRRGRWLALVLTVGLPALCIAQSFPFYDLQQGQVNQRRRSHVPTLQALLPEAERSHLVFMIPPVDAFHSEFERTAALHWELYTTRAFMDFLSDEPVRWLICDPDGIYDQTWLRLLEIEVVPSLDVLSADRDVLLVCPSYALRVEPREELREATELPGTHGVLPVSFWRVER